MRRFVALCLIGLFLAMRFVVAQDSIGPYNPIADVNKDGIVDILDLVEVGQSYGSNYVLMHRANKTTVTVLSYENDNFSYVEDALVAIFTPGASEESALYNYTDSSGTVAFQLSPNSTYVAIAWNTTRNAYNYASFTTNLLGEASVAIWLNYYQESSPIRSIPQGWLVILILDNGTGRLASLTGMDWFDGTGERFTANGHEQVSWNGSSAFFIGIESSVFKAENTYWWNVPLANFACDLGDYHGQYQRGNFTYRTDEFGGAYVTPVLSRNP